MTSHSRRANSVENVEPSPWIPVILRITIYSPCDQRISTDFYFLIKKVDYLGQNLVGGNVLKTVLPQSILQWLLHSLPHFLWLVEGT